MRAVLLALSLVLAACTGPVAPTDAGPDPSLDAGPPATLVIGAGESVLAPIADGDTLLLARGCQGLQHVWITLGATNIDPRGVRVALSLTRASDGLVVSSVFDIRLSFTPEADGASAQLSALTLVVPTPDDALDRDLVMHGEIRDRAGRVATQDLHVRIAWGTEVCG
jgi:hypothetical protein